MVRIDRAEEILKQQNAHGENMTLDEIKLIVRECLGELFAKDFPLLQHDVSERAITHKLAEYLQGRFPGLKVDCEYNRNTAKGNREPKQLLLLRNMREERIDTDLGESRDEDDLLAISVYPDIIVHKREINSENLLVIEVKKRNSKVNPKYDHQKLEAFTDTTEQNPYHYNYGVFVLLDTGSQDLKEPELTWFIEGKIS